MLTHLAAPLLCRIACAQPRIAVKPPRRITKAREDRPGPAGLGTDARSGADRCFPKRARGRLGYLTWRDCKASLVVFNKEISGFTELLEKVPATLHSHPFFVKDVGQKGGGEWRFIFRSEEDEHRQIAVHMFLFDLFVS